MNYPGNQMEFEEMFKTDQDCIDYLTKVDGHMALNVQSVVLSALGKRAKDDLNVLIAIQKQQ